MQRFKVILLILICSFITCCFSAHLVYANDEAAVEYFKKGEYYFNKEKYDDAMQWYKKAIDERRSDGTITFSDPVTKTVPYGRSFKKVTEYESRYEDYYPNRRVSEIMEKTQPADLVVSVRFVEGDPQLQNKSIDPEEEAFLIVTVTNKGKGRAFDVKLNVENDNKQVKHQQDYPLGDLNSGVSTETKISLNPDQKLTTGVAGFVITCSEKRGYNCKENKMSIPTAALEPPDLIAKFLRFRDKGNGDGRLDAGERGEVVILVENQGNGTAFGVTPRISSDEKYLSIGSPDTQEIDMMSPHEKREIHIPVEGWLDLTGGEVKVLVEAKERRGFDARKVKVSLETVKLARPVFVIKSVRVMDGSAGQAQGNNNSILENGETAEIHVFVNNAGKGDAFGVRLRLVDITPNGIEVLQDASDIGQIGVGETAKGKIVVRVPRHLMLNKVNASFKVEEAERKAANAEETLALNARTLKPELALDVDWSDNQGGLARGNGNGIWESGETIEGTVTVSNHGSIAAEGVEVKLRLNDRELLLNPSNFSIGRLATNQTSLPQKTTIAIPRIYNGTKVTIDAAIVQKDFTEVKESYAKAITILKPVLVVSQRIFNMPAGEKGTIGSVIQGEKIKLEIRIRNEGTTDAKGVTVKVSSKRPEMQLTGETFFSLGTMPAGQGSEPLPVPLLVARSMPVGPAEVVVDVTQDDFEGAKHSGILIVQEEGAEEVKVAGEIIRPVRPVLPVPVAANPVLIVSSEPEGEVVQDTFDLVWEIKGEVLSYEVRVNGDLIPAEQGGRGIGLSEKAKTGVSDRQRRKIPLKQGINNIEVIAYDLSNNQWKDRIQVTRVSERGEIWAVVIGVSAYQNVPRLKYARRDAESFYEYLTEYMGISPDHIRTLYDEEVTQKNMKTVLGTWLKQKAGRHDTVFIYFAGHGAPEPDKDNPDGDGFEKYLLPMDAEPEDLYATAFPMKAVSDIFGRLNSDRVVFIVDSCFSGASGGRTMLASDNTRGALLSEDFLERLSKGKGRVILSASRANEVSLEDVRYGGGHGVFMHFLLKGLKGEADYSMDGVVDVDELHQYLSKEVPQATGQSQTPVKKGEVEGRLIVGRAKSPLK